VKTGKLKHPIGTRGFSFIKSDDGSEAFVHATDIKEEIGMGDILKYEEMENIDKKTGKIKGIKAINIIKC
jgi:cold shock CspA family protein